MSVSVSPDGSRGAGYALVRIPGAGTVADATFRIARPPGWPEPNLGPFGWQGAEASLVPDEIRREGSDLVLVVGPAVCSALEEDTYIFTLAAAGLTAPVVWPAIEEVHGGSVHTFARPQPPASGGGPSVVVPHEPPTSPPTPPPAPPSTLAPLPAGSLAVPPDAAIGGSQPVRTGKTAAPAVLAVAALLLVAAGGGWWWAYRAGPDASPAAPAVPVDAQPRPVTPPAPDPDALSVAELVSRNDPQQMLAQAQKRLAGRPQDTILLLEAAGEDRHFGPALTMLARLYDPNKPREGGVPANPRQAAKYYRDANHNNDPSGRDDRDALRRSLQSRRDAGDLNAKLTELDFWP